MKTPDNIISPDKIFRSMLVGKYEICAEKVSDKTGEILSGTITAVSGRGTEIEIPLEPFTYNSLCEYLSAEFDLDKEVLKHYKDAAYSLSYAPLAVCAKDLTDLYNDLKRFTVTCAVNIKDSIEYNGVQTFYRNGEEEITWVKITEEKYPDIYRHKMAELIGQGMTEEEAAEWLEDWQVALELYYDPQHGLMGIESEAMECLTKIYSPYTGQTLAVDEDEYLSNEDFR